MRPTLLLIAAIFSSILCEAQENSSVLFNGQVTLPRGAHPLSIAEMDHMATAARSRFLEQAPARKGTAGTITHDWYYLWAQNYTPGTSEGYSYAIFPDSNVLDVSGSTPNNIYTRGLGMSFDPTDSAYWSPSITVNNAACIFPVSVPMPLLYNTYTVDSFYTSVKYYRNDPSSTIVDSLIIEMAVVDNYAADSGAYNLRFSTATTDFLPMAYDMRPRFGTLHYNSGMRTGFNMNPYINDCYFDSVFAPKQRFAFALNAAAAADTDAYGFLNLGSLTGQYFKDNAAPVALTPTPGLYSLPMAGPRSVIINGSSIIITAGHNPHLVTFTTFKSGHAGGTYPLGTPTTAANWIKLFSGSPLGSTTWFRQNSSNGIYAGSYQHSLAVHPRQRYTDTFFTFPTGSHEVLMAACYFNTPAFIVTDNAYHVSWAPFWGSASGINVPEMPSVYPNPASNELNISFSSSGTAAVTLTNMVGQVVATQYGESKVTFNTAELPAGLYVFTEECNGLRSTGRAVIAH